MASEMYLFDRSYKAENDLSAKQFRFVEMSGSDQIDVCDGTADIAIGVLQNDPLAGQAAQVRHLGVSKVVTNGTTNGGISIGSWVGTDAVGKGIRKSADKDWVAGIALDASSADGVIIRVLLMPQFLAV